MAKKELIAEQAYQAILMDILTCVLEPGSQMTQSELNDRYALGVTPVREALKRLEVEGYVRAIPRFGYIISPITVQDVEEIYELRTIIELASLRHAIQRASEAQIAGLEKYAQVTYTYKDTRSYQRFLEHNNAFHYAIAVSGGNCKLADLLLDLLNQMIRIFNLGLDLRDSADEMRYEHLALVNAIKARDVSLAEQIALDQINRSKQRVLQMLTQKLENRRQADIDLIIR